MCPCQCQCHQPDHKTPDPVEATHMIVSGIGIFAMPFLVYWLGGWVLYPGYYSFSAVILVIGQEWPPWDFSSMRMQQVMFWLIVSVISSGFWSSLIIVPVMMAKDYLEEITQHTEPSTTKIQTQQ